MNKTTKAIGVFFICLFVSWSARAEEVVVEGESVPEPETVHTTGSVTVIDATAAVDRVTDVAEAIEESAGVTVKRYGGLGGYSVVMIRGTGPNQTSVFLDGVPLSGAAVGAVNLADLPMDALRCIEVYRGVAPIGFGGAPLGGVVNLVTRTAGTGLTAGAAVSYGSFETYKIDLFASNSLEDRNFLFFYNHLGSKGDFEYKDDNATLYNEEDDETIERQNNDFTSDDILLKAGHKIGDHFELFLVNEYFRKFAGVPGFSTLRVNDATLSTMRNTSYVGGRYLGSVAEVRALAYYAYIEEKYSDPEGEIGLGRQKNRYITRTAGLNSMGRFFIGSAAMVGLFVEGKKESYNEYNLLGDNSWPDNERITYAGAAQGEVYLFDAKVILVPTIRAESYESDFGGSGSATYNFASESESSSDTMYSPHFGLRLNPLQPLSFTANIGRYYRVPTFTELFGDRGGSVGNPDLDPETGIHVDGGVELKFKDFSFLDKLRFAYAVYYLDVEDIIILVQNSQRTVQAQNVSEAEILGHEFSFDIIAAGALKTHATYTFQQTRDRSGVSYLDGNPLPGRPENEFHFNAAVFRKGWGEIFYTFDYMDGNYLDRAGYLEANARRIHGVGVTATPLEGLSITFEAKNIGDDRVSDIIGYPLPGRSYFGTVRYVFSENRENTPSGE